MNHLEQRRKGEEFQRLHRRGCLFVLPNAWDVISAKMFEGSGFQAIGTTSAGIAGSLGYPDGQHLPVEKMMEVVENIAGSVGVPVSVDIEAGYGRTVEGVVETVRGVMAVGAVGINIEDGAGDADRLQEAIAAIRKFSDDADVPFFINARTDMYWLDIGDPSKRFQEAVKRAAGYRAAGADGIFIPGVDDREMIRNLRKEISGPLNLLVSPAMPSLDELERIGIERLSCGSAPFRAGITLLKQMGEEVLHHRSFHRMTEDVISYGEMARFMHKTRK